MDIGQMWMLGRYRCWTDTDIRMEVIDIKLHIRRPLCVLTLLFVLILFAGHMSGLYDPGGRSFSEADDRHLFLQGTVLSREALSSGYRITLGHIEFKSRNFSYSDQSSEHISFSSTLASSSTGSTPGPSSTESTSALSYTSTSLSNPPTFSNLASDAYENLIFSINADLLKRDRILVFLNGEDSQDMSEIFNSVRIGDRVTLYGKCSEPDRATNPGQFDIFRYYRERNIILTMTEVSVCEATRPSLSEAVLRKKINDVFILAWYAILNKLADLRMAMRSGITNMIGGEDEALLYAVVTGDRSALDDETRQLFQDGGVSWFLTVSSVHISYLGIAIYSFLRKRSGSFVLASACSAMVVISYSIMAGGSISSQRAVILLLFRLGSQIYGRTYDRLSALGAAAIFILAREPCALFGSSFLMSFACILSLEYLPVTLATLVRPRSYFMRHLITSAGLQIGIFPLSMWFFYQVTPYSVILNLILFPCMSMLFAFGLAACLVRISPFFLAYTLGKMLMWPCHCLLIFVRVILKAERLIPFSVLITGRPMLWQIIIYYAILSLLTMILVRKSKKFIISHLKNFRIKFLFLFLILLIMVSFRAQPRFRVTFLDVGQGMCALIEQGNYTCLIDAGSSSVNDVWKYRIDSTLKYYGIRELDTVFLSHGDSDHINGILQMLDLYRRNLAGRNSGDVTVSQIYIPDIFREDERLALVIDQAADNGIPIAFVKEGASLTHGDLELDILSPSEDRLTGSSNEDCIVLWMKYRDRAILFMGDMEKEGEKMFVDAYTNDGRFSPSRHTVLVVGHHGSKYATSNELLSLVKPSFAIISCGKDNRYGHPSEEVLERLKNAGVKWHRTDTEGAMEMKQKTGM